MQSEVNQLLDQAFQARREHRLDDALGNLIEAVALCRQAGLRWELIESLKALGQIERDLGRGELALPLYEEAVALCREENDPLALAHTVRHLGDIHRHANHLTLAEPCYLEALVIYRGHEQTKTLDLANAIRPLAILKEATGELAEAASLWREAKELYQAAGVTAGVAGCEARLAKLIE